MSSLSPRHQNPACKLNPRQTDIAGKKAYQPVEGGGYTSAMPAKRHYLLTLAASFSRSGKLPDPRELALQHIINHKNDTVKLSYN